MNGNFLYNQDSVGRDWEPPFVWITGCFRSSVPSALTLGCRFFAFPSKSLIIAADLTQTSRVPDSVFTGIQVLRKQQTPGTAKALGRVEWGGWASHGLRRAIQLLQRQAVAL